MEANENMPIKFYCEKCDYGCCKKSSWTQHLLTAKHNKANFGLIEANEKYACDICSVKFKHQSSYCRHKKKCQKGTHHEKNAIIKNDSISDKELIIMLINDNKEMRNLLFEQAKERDEYKNMMMEVIKNGVSNSNTNHSHNTTNSHNKAFNLNFFLNETCKDAMNINQFIETIKLQLSDLEKFGDVGYVEGISNIITTNLKAMDITQRPVHCTDKKRETMYIKDNDHWEKDDDNKSKLRKIIKTIANKNIRLLPQFREKYPDYNNSSSRTSDRYDKMVVEAMGGAGNNDIEKEDKIIRNISNIVTINK